MTNVPYNTNIPFASNSPSQDQPRMQENTNSLKSLIEIDHIGFGNNQGGYHKDIHQPVVPVGGQTSWNPLIGSPGRLAVEAAAIAGVQQLFALNYTPDTTGGVQDTQLFSLTGGGGINQFTGSASNATDGWCWLGGILIQWGKVLGTHGAPPLHFNGGDTDTVTFKDRFAGAIPFPNSCFAVWTSLNYNVSTPSSNSGVGNVTVNEASLSRTNFTWFVVTNSGAYTSFFWVAIGN